MFKFFFHVTLLLKGRVESNWSLIGWARIDPLGDLTVSRKQTVLLQKSQSRSYLEVQKINQPESGWWNGFEQGSAENRLHCVAVIDTLAFENEALPTVTSLGMDNIQERPRVHNYLIESLSATVFTSLFLSVCLIPQNGSLSGNQLPPSVSLPPLPTPGVFWQKMLIWAYQSSGPMPNSLWEVPTRKWLTPNE